jgi:hypothetical protein
LRRKTLSVSAAVNAQICAFESRAPTSHTQLQEGPPAGVDKRRARQLGGTIAALSASQLSRATTGIACISRAPHVAPMVSTLLGRLMAFGVGVGVGSAGSYYFILEELKSSTAAILAANKALAARVGKVESAAKKQ